MKIGVLSDVHFDRRLPQKIFLVMKLTTLLLITALVQVSAKGYSQITIAFHDAPIEKVMLSIENQTGYVFMYNAEDLKNTKVSVTLHDATIQDALRVCFQKTALLYKIIDKNVVIFKNEKGNGTLAPTSAKPQRLYGIIKEDSTDLVLPGARIEVTLAGPGSVSSAANGTMTVSDSDGQFSMLLEPGEYKIAVSYIGFKPYENTISLGDRELFLSIALEPSVATLQDVVVFLDNGYQKISSEQATGSFNNIDKNQLSKPSVNLAERLIGTTAGMDVRLNEDGSPTLQLRGKTTLYANGLGGATGDNTPLVVVDGFPIKGFQDNAFANINPNDIESVTVLKDAAAASIWGARSSNGVIVVTTKSGRKNTGIKVELSAFTRFSQKADVGYLTGQASSAEWVEFEKLAFGKWGSSPIAESIYSNYWQSAPAIILNEYNLGHLTSEQRDNQLDALKSRDNRGQISDYLLDNRANTQYNVTLSGGGERISNIVSLLAESSQSDLKGNDSRRFAVNTKTSMNLYKWLDFDVAAYYQYTKSNNNGMAPYEINALGPYQMLKNPDGSLTNIPRYNQPLMERLVPLQKFPYSFSYNPIEEIANRDRTSSNTNARINAGFTFKILDGLTLASRIQYENISVSSRNYDNDRTFFVRDRINTTSTWDQTPTGDVTPNLPLGGILDQSRSNTNAYTIRNVLNFSRHLGTEHEINMVAGSDVANTVIKFYSDPTTYGYNDKTLTVGTFPNGPTGTTDWNGWSNNFNYTSSFSESTQRLFSLFSNVAYTYRGRYTLSGSYRTDASNLIAKASKYRYSPFYSAGIAYEISDEDFMRNFTWINRLNFRATLGRTGNVDRSTSPFTLITLLPDPNIYTRDYLATINNLGNPELTWEKTQTLNVGLDYAFFASKLFGRVDFYRKEGTNLLANISVPSVTGARFASFNNANLQNNGIEVTLGTSIPIRGNTIAWTGSLNMSYNRSRITKLFQTSNSSLVFGGTSAYAEGYDPSTAWAYRYAGVVDGRPKIKGPDENTLLNLTDFQSLDGRTYLKNAGPTNPPYLLGMTNSFKIHDFNVSFIMVAKFGAVFKAQSFNYPTSGSVNLNRKVGEVLTGDPDKIVPLPADPNDFTYFGYFNASYLDYNYLSANLVRLREVSVSYNLPAKWLAKTRLGGAQLIVQGNDLHTWLANNTGEDPEFLVGTFRPRPQYTFGVKVQL